MTAPVRFEFRRAAAASNRRLWSRYRFRISLRSAASTECVSVLPATRFRRTGHPCLERGMPAGRDRPRLPARTGGRRLSGCRDSRPARPPPHTPPNKNVQFDVPLSGRLYQQRLPPHRKEKEELMSRIERRWRIGALAGLVALAHGDRRRGRRPVLVRLRRGRRDDHRRHDGHRHEHRPGRGVRLRVVHARGERLQQPLPGDERREGRSVARDEVRTGRNRQDVALHPPPRASRSATARASTRPT